MTTLELMLFLSLLVGLGLLLFVLWPDYEIDRTRQRLFRIRDELFRAFQEGELRFDNEAYCLTRSMLNGLIRYAHEISFTHMMMISTVDSPSIVEFRNHFAECLKNSADEEKRHIVSALKQIDKVIVLHIIARSNFLQFVKGFLFIRQWVSRRLRTSIRAVEVEAFNRYEQERVGQSGLATC